MGKNAEFRAGLKVRTISAYIPSAGDSITLRLLPLARLRELMGEVDPKTGEPTVDGMARVIAEALTDPDDDAPTLEEARALVEEYRTNNAPLVMNEIMEAIGKHVMHGEAHASGNG